MVCIMQGPYSSIKYHQNKNFKLINKKFPEQEIHDFLQHLTNIEIFTYLKISSKPGVVLNHTHKFPANASMKSRVEISRNTNTLIRILKQILIVRIMNIMFIWNV